MGYGTLAKITHIFWGIKNSRSHKPLKWSKSLTPEDAKELKRLERDGHKITLDKRNYVIETTLETTRATQLFRTIPHEVGHNVDFHSTGYNEYCSKPHSEREAFAHRYADEFAEAKKSFIPFERKFDPVVINDDGLKKEWFLF